MSLEGEGGVPEEVTPMRVPRWYNPVIIALGLAGLGTYVATEGQFTWTFLLAVVAAVVGFLVLLWVQRSVRRGERSPATEATYSSSTIFGAIWIGLGIMQAAVLDQYVLGGFMIMFGVVTVAAFGIPLLRERARRNAAGR